MNAIPASTQFRAVAQLRWQLFRNGLRREGGKGELAARIIAFPLMAGLIILPVAGSFAAGWAIASPGGSLRYLLPLFTAIFALQIVVSINVSPPGLSFDPNSLIRFPLNFTRFLVLRILLGLLSASTIVGTLSYLAAATAVAWRLPHLAAVAFAAALLIALTAMLLIRMVFAWVDRWLSTRRARELFTVFIFIFSLGFQYINVTFNGLGHHSNRAQQAARIAAAQRTYHFIQPVLFATPPGLAGNSILHAARGATTPAVLDLAGLILTGALCLAVFAWRMQREYRGENLSEAGPRAAAQKLPAPDHHTALTPAHPSRPLIQASPSTIPPVILASLQKEFLYIRRNTSQFYGLVAPLAMIFILAGRLGSMSRSGFVFPIAALYSMLGIAALSYNTLGLDGAGVQLYFYAPVSFRSVILAKNIFGFLVNLLQIVLLCVVLSFTAGLPTAWTLASTITWLVFVILVNVTVGNRRSLTAPKRIDPGKLNRKQASQLSALLSLAIVLAAGALGAGLLLLARFLGKLWLPVPVLLVLAAAALGLYLAGLRRIDALALKHRETLIEELTKVSV